MRQQNRRFIFLSLLPALICFLLLFVYPTVRTVVESFFSTKQLSDPITRWTFAGLQNYRDLFSSNVFLMSLGTIGKIWIIGGAATVTLAILFAVILNSGVKGRKFWRSLIYLPNTISAVAMVNIWSLYVYNNKYGLVHTVLKNLGFTELAKVSLTDGTHTFGAMLVAYCFGYIGYLMLIFMAGMEGIPTDLYESAHLDGANAWQKFWRITMPLLREVFRSCLMFWTISTIGFFVWSQLWSRISELSLMTPMLYMYNITFTTGATGNLTKNIGAGCAICVIMMLLVVLFYVLFNVILKERKYEY